MLRSVLRFILLVAVLLGANPTARAFSLLGPFDPWQIEALSYFGGELGGVKNLGNEYRLNTPTITYGYDSTFLDYFGLEGVKAVDQAFAILNKLPNVSRASATLSEFPLEARNEHATADALNLVDLKSVVLSLMLEHAGLMSEDNTFRLRHRVLPPGATCPNYIYTVIIRNFDPITLQPTPYVNDNLLTYQIVELCPTPSRADAVEFLVDPTDFQFSSAASFYPGIQGEFLTGLTRDDFGGLRYLYRSRNYNNEPLPTNAFGVLSFSPFLPVSFFTNSFATNTVALRGGVEKVKYVKTRYDSLLGTIFVPMLQSYKIPTVSNFKVTSQAVRRAVFRPDILLTAADISSDAASFPIVNPTAARSINYSDAPRPVVITDGGFGPGIIEPQKVITFNKIGPYFNNRSPFFLDELTATKGFIWGSFDGSTNDPVVYPSGTSIRDIERLVLSDPN